MTRIYEKDRNMDKDIARARKLVESAIKEFHASIDQAVDVFVHNFARLVVDWQFGISTSPAPTQKAKVRRSAAQMRCRAPGCKNRSKGPRFGYMCGEHIDVQREIARQRGLA